MPLQYIPLSLNNKVLSLMIHVAYKVATLQRNYITNVLLKCLFSPYLVSQLFINFVNTCKYFFNPCTIDMVWEIQNLLSFILCPGLCAGYRRLSYTPTPGFSTTADFLKQLFLANLFLHKTTNKQQCPIQVTRSA